MDGRSGDRIGFLVPKVVAVGTYQFVRPPGEGSEAASVENDTRPNHEKCSVIRLPIIGESKWATVKYAARVVGQFATLESLADVMAVPRTEPGWEGLKTWAANVLRFVHGLPFETNERIRITLSIWESLSRDKKESDKKRVRGQSSNSNKKIAGSTSDSSSSSRSSKSGSPGPRKKTKH